MKQTGVGPVPLIHICREPIQGLQTGAAGRDVV